MMGEGPMTHAPPLRGRFHKGKELHPEHFDASMHVMYKSQTMMMDTNRDLTLHGPGNPLAFHFQLRRFLLMLLGRESRINSEGEVKQLRMREMSKKKRKYLKTFRDDVILFCFTLFLFYFVFAHFFPFAYFFFCVLSLWGHLAL